ncbi:hypothetical protein POM88_033247 [Heracleum sosnowskyi]|uniref:AMP-dependent synthetase/ligase domain-containing protein n=1 Tax=Heracleum sosnowskyi TaxID=360622 RepID=A0AAD8I242_9APIA|nr:hypothetical protein POM88_033247 [Heracleum sosnowskyi]
MAGDVINTVNVRLNAGATSFLLEHSERGAVEYEKFLETSDPGFPWKPPQDEWKTIALGYTSGTSICLRQVTAEGVYSAIANNWVTHFCAAPVGLNTLVNAPQKEKVVPLPRLVHVHAMAQHGFCVTHTYGLSETFGPSTVNAWKPEWDKLSPEEQAKLNSRQGVQYVGLEGLEVVDKDTKPVPADGTTIREIVFRGNVVMKGYLKNPKSNAEAFANGW